MLWTSDKAIEDYVQGIKAKVNNFMKKDDSMTSSRIIAIDANKK